MPIPSICWLAALVALLALEAATVGLVSLWFAVGSLCALLTSFFVGNIWVQFAVFLAVSFLCLVIIRPWPGSTPIPAGRVPTPTGSSAPKVWSPRPSTT
ncbi:hypothetical protein M5E87_10395 [Flavonifractor plautii]|nr:hypothetical protein M5E87_10395 [Flavonifractor plautii]